MRYLIVRLASVVFISTLLVLSISLKNKPEIPKQFSPNEKGFAVMELFTSQGCSSCPPADNLLGRYAEKNDDRIMLLSFHVDYWNRLGWTDSFSSSKYSRRQRDYAMIIENSSVYTPQLIINGQKEMVGSDESKVSNELANALKIIPYSNVLVKKISKENNLISISYEVVKLYANTTLHAALIQKQVNTNILKGENRGLKLVNKNVVRDFISTPLKTESGMVSLHLPQGYDEKDFAFVFFVQEDASGKIIAATKNNL